jgi:predicted DNA-binding antitoxin AbrB/MazE fold protein
MVVVVYSGVSVMAITVEAVYENGVLKPARPLPWKDGERVCVTVSSLDSPLLKAYGIMNWTGDAQTLERIALDPEFLPEQAK